MGIFGDDSSHDDYLKLEARIATLEAAVSDLSATVAGLRGGHGGTAAPSNSPASAPRWEFQARVLKQAGKAIEAIKLVREQTGWDLRQSKDFVDRL
jgi:ribosomal protein L7/L12